MRQTSPLESVCVLEMFPFAQQGIAHLYIPFLDRRIYIMLKNILHMNTLHISIQ